MRQRKSLPVTEWARPRQISDGSRPVLHPVQIAPDRGLAYDAAEKVRIIVVILNEEDEFNGLGWRILITDSNSLLPRRETVHSAGSKLCVSQSRRFRPKPGPEIWMLAPVP